MLAHSAYPRRQQLSSSSSSSYSSSLSPSPFPTSDLPAYDPPRPLSNGHRFASNDHLFDDHQLHSPYYSHLPVTAHHQPLFDSNHYMTTPFPLDPPIRLHQPTPSPVSPPSAHQLYDPRDHHSQSSSPWSRLGDQSHLAAGSRQHRLSLQSQFSSHKRNSSGSSIGTLGPASPNTPASSFPRIVDPDSFLQFPGYETIDNVQPAQSPVPKPWPHDWATTLVLPFLPSSLQDYYPPSSNAEAHLTALRRGAMAQQDSELDNSSSSFLPNPCGADADDGLKAPLEVRSNMPKLDRTMSDIYLDELYNPNMTTSVSTPPARASAIQQNNLLSPQTDVFSERLQQAKRDHMTAGSVSPAASISRERSPFRQGSQWAAEGYPPSNSPPPRLLSAAQLRERQKAQADADALAQHRPSHDSVRPVDTISPKEVELDYSETEEDSRKPPFVAAANPSRPTNGTLDRFSASQLSSQDSIPSDTGDSITQHDFALMRAPRRESSNFSTSSGIGATRVDFPATGTQIPQQYPFISHSRRQTSSIRSSSDQAPEFPANLTSMESTKSDSGAQSSQDATEHLVDVQRPTNTMADSGTYSCPFPGCILRFDSSSKMLKHKRDNHRTGLSESRASAGNSTPANSRSSPNSPASAQLAGRNTQAGPHKCERINPSTGKPCNSVFSRPYDLTRHEDTIHNTRKHKVRCQFCTEEKTFSRNDALTRHMRVVHPDVDFAGKTKRKNAV